MDEFMENDEAYTPEALKEELKISDIELNVGGAPDTIEQLRKEE